MTHTWLCTHTNTMSHWDCASWLVFRVFAHSHFISVLKSSSFFGWVLKYINLHSSLPIVLQISNTQQFQYYLRIFSCFYYLFHLVNHLYTLQVTESIPLCQASLLLYQ